QAWRAQERRTLQRLAAAGFPRASPGQAVGQRRWRSADGDGADRRQLAGGGFLDNKRNIVLIGGAGTGKSHIAIGITRSIIRASKKARFFNAVDLANKLEIEMKLDRQGRTADGLMRVNLVIIDELGYLPLAQSGGQLLFHLISRLYERTSII